MTSNINENLSIEDQLKHLENKEERLRMSRDVEETALVSRKKNFRPFQKQGSELSSSNSNTVECFLCEGDHYVIECEFLEYCKSVVLKLKEKKAKRRYKKSHYKYKPKIVKKKKNHGLVGADGYSDSADTNDTSSSSEYSEDSELDVAAITKEKLKNSRDH